MANATLDAVLQQVLAGTADENALLEALAQALVEGTEVLSLRDPTREAEGADGTVALLTLAAPIGKVWVCLTAARQVPKTGGGHSAPTAELKLSTLFSMAEDTGVAGVVFNPAQQSGLTVSTAAFPDIRVRAERLRREEQARLLKKAGTNPVPGWIM